MFDEKEFNKNIKKCIELLFKNQYLIQAGCLTSLNASDEFKKKSRNSNTYREIYDLGAVNQDFNFMLKDNSFFQFSQEKNGNIRLVYYPNPYNSLEYQDTKLEIEKMLENNDITHEDYEQFLSEEFFSGDIPLIRYDYSIDQYCKNYHPAAHFHIGFHSENRWPVKRILSPFVFTLKILMLYYPNLWKIWGDNNENPNLLDELYRKELQSCNLVDAEYFCDLDENRLYFN